MDASEHTDGLDPAELKGDALDAALEERGLSTEGRAEEKRARLTESLGAESPHESTVSGGGGPDSPPEVKPLETGGSGDVLVRTRYPVDQFDHSVDGVPPITAAGVKVQRGKVADLLEAAASADTRLEEVV